MGGRLSLVVSFSIAAFSGSCLLFVGNNPTLVPFFLFWARLGVAAVCNVNTIVNITVFPVDFRTTSFGICNIFARAAAIVAPLMAELAYPTPFIILIVLTALNAFVSFFL